MPDLPALTQELVHSLLRYVPETGAFFWKSRPNNDRWNNRNASAVAGSTTKYGYVKIQIGKRCHYSAHVLAWLYVYGEYLPGEIDHRHGARGDNRINELRRTTKSQNSVNKAKQRNNISGFVGVTFSKQMNKWHARVTINGRTKHVGFFSTAEGAAKAREKRARELQGEFAPLDPDRARYLHHRDLKKPHAGPSFE